MTVGTNYLLDAGDAKYTVNVQNPVTTLGLVTSHNYTLTGYYAGWYGTAAYFIATEQIDNGVLGSITFSTDPVSVNAGDDTPGNNVASSTAGATLSFSSDKPAIATVDASTGIVTGVAEGSAVITVSHPASAGNYTAANETYTVNVLPAGALSPASSLENVYSTTTKIFGSWTASGSASVTKYKWEIWTATGGTGTKMGNGEVSSPTIALSGAAISSALTAGTTYYLRIIASDGTNDATAVEASFVAAKIVFTSANEAGWEYTSSPSGVAEEGTYNGITLACNAGNWSSNQYRCYKNKVLTISSAIGNIDKIEFTCASGYGASGYGTAATTGGGSFTTSETSGTWDGSAATVEFTASSKAVRMTQITITLE